MNYFEHHLGDYAAATAHLSWDEDMAYTRLLRAYYHHERAIPEGQQYRLSRAATPAQKRAVDAVLGEFFELVGGEFKQKRAEAEIARFHAGEPERAVRKANEDNRLRRHREERSALFKQLTDVGQHAPWNVGMNELRALVKRLSETPPETGPETPLPPSPATAPATPATATQTPYPDTIPIPKEKKDGEPTTGVARASESEDEGQEPTPASPYGPIAKAMRQAGLGDAHPGDLKFRALVDQGATTEEFVAAATEAARQRKPFAWALAAVIGKRRDAAAVQLAPAVAAPVLAVKVYVPEPRATAEERAESVRGREEALAKLRGLGMRLKAVG